MFWGQKDSTAGKVLALHATDSGSIFGTSKDPLRLPGVIPEHRFWVWPQNENKFPQTKLTPNI